jgi:hypothetical protein
MSRSYEVTVGIERHDVERKDDIVQACCDNWDFEPQEFDDLGFPGDNPKLTATAEGQLCGGEAETEFADRLTTAIWKANRGYCYVEVRATCLEDLPFEDYCYDEDRYDDLMETQE